jgi:galactose-1-phosphate uridylyltransferase
MTAALLDRNVSQLIGTQQRATLKEKQALAAIIHLCGSKAGRDFAARRFRLKPHQRCGDHDARTYLTRVELLTQQFATLNTAG